MDPIKIFYESYCDLKEKRLKKRLEHRCFPVKCERLLRILFLNNICER